MISRKTTARKGVNMKVFNANADQRAMKKTSQRDTPATVIGFGEVKPGAHKVRRENGALSGQFMGRTIYDAPVVFSKKQKAEIEEWVSLMHG
jgi:hypothetical protein